MTIAFGWDVKHQTKPNNPYAGYTYILHYTLDFCVTCKAWSTLKDHVSLGIHVVTLLVSDRKLLKGCINFIQTLQKGKTSLNIGQVQKWRSFAKF